ncbi:YeiH family protein [Halopseudomonas pelagia]|uniref:Sulfate exporter family transporter n=1 Tax=Halopseudomonas pelagia TaxID=553151 RepID=A0AA91U295_9GAMM|nr:putative sulfate exporter family transporter [Halopseudomonas pelagia]PCC99269.1 putative sulfate exporter family transporter [Halopseudomonas pelagia]QFY55027.1 putative sulfate exporter family transporter [Halopseudomonas pelagia]
MTKYTQHAFSDYFRTLLSQARGLLPGILISLVIALASSFIAEHYGGPALLFALMFGMSCHFLIDDGRCVPGIEFASKTILRLGVALLGARITVGQIGGLGSSVMLGAILAVAATIGFGWLAARLLGLRSDFGVLTGGAVAICGASAALAISAILPKHENSERDTLLTVVGVTGLSTLAMILYPILTAFLGLKEEQTGVFLGGTIHDVAQVVGAGYMISPLTGDTATLVKLMRVALLVPSVMIIGWLFYRRQSKQKVLGKNRAQLLPGFLIAFAVLVVINSVGVIPSLLTDTMGEISRGCLMLAISALGVKTSLKELAIVGWRPILLLCAETVFLAILVLCLLLLAV